MPLEAQVEYTADGVANDFTVTFGYLKKSHVKLYINGVEDQTFTWLDSTSIAATTLPANNDVVLITRNTPRAALVYSIPNSGTYKGADLNNQALQALYIAAEGYDALENTISLDTNDNKWDADTKRIKNVTDPVDAQDVATKNYADTNGASQAGQAKASADAAATSASAASTSETNAATSASTATTQAGNAATSASDAADDAAVVAGAVQSVADAEAWAITAEDTLVPAANGGNEVDEYSALHWAAKSEASSTAALAAQTAAEEAVDGIAAVEYPNNARELLRGNQGIGFDFLSRDFEIIDYSGTLTVAPTIIAHAATTNMVQASTGGPVTDRDGTSNALAATEMPFDHLAVGDIYTPLGYYAETGAQLLDIDVADFPYDVDHWTMYARFRTTNSGTQIIQRFYSTSTATDSVYLWVDAGVVKATVYSGTVLEGTISLGTLTTNVVYRAAVTFDPAGTIRGIGSGQTTVQSAGSITAPAALATFEMGTSLVGHLQQSFVVDRRFSDDELKTICGVAL